MSYPRDYGVPNICINPHLSGSLCRHNVVFTELRHPKHLYRRTPNHVGPGYKGVLKVLKRIYIVKRNPYIYIASITFSLSDVRCYKQIYVFFYIFCNWIKNQWQKHLNMFLLIILSKTLLSPLDIAFRKCIPFYYHIFFFPFL